MLLTSLDCTTRMFALESMCVSVCLSVRHQLAKTLITLEPHGIILIKFSILIHVIIIYRPPCITVFFDGRGFAEYQLKIWDQFVKMFISWTPWYIPFKFCILMYFNIVQPLPCKKVTRLRRASFGRSSWFSKNAHYSLTPWYNHFKFCILMYFNIVRPLPCKTVTRLCRASFWPVRLIIYISTTGCAYYCQLIRRYNFYHDL